MTAIGQQSPAARPMPGADAPTHRLARLVVRLVKVLTRNKRELQLGPSTTKTPFAANAFDASIHRVENFDARGNVLARHHPKRTRVGRERAIDAADDGGVLVSVNFAGIVERRSGEKAECLEPSGRV
jgi:hypothetical protein